MVAFLTVAVATALILGVVFSARIKSWLHGQESQIGAKLKAEAEKAVSGNPVDG